MSIIIILRAMINYFYDDNEDNDDIYNIYGYIR